jgi:DNA-nicking Smr family endonuclease
MKIEIPKCVDLHGKTVNQGFNLTRMFAIVSRNEGRSHAKIITGRSGQMRKEIASWIEGPLKDVVESFKFFDDNGSCILKLRKKKV